MKYTEEKFKSAMARSSRRYYARTGREPRIDSDDLDFIETLFYWIFVHPKEKVPAQIVKPEPDPDPEPEEEGTDQDHKIGALFSALADLVIHGIITTEESGKFSKRIKAIASKPDPKHVHKDAPTGGPPD